MRKGRGEPRGKGGRETYRAVFPPPVENVADVKGCFELVWHAGPDPLITQAAAALLVQEPLAVEGEEVPRPETAALVTRAGSDAIDWSSLTLEEAVRISTGESELFELSVAPVIARSPEWSAAKGG